MLCARCRCAAELLLSCQRGCTCTASSACIRVFPLQAVVWAYMCLVCETTLISLQELLRGEGPLMFSLGTFAIGSSAMFDYAHPSAMFALAVVKLLASKPLPFRVDAALSRELSAWMLEAAGMVSPASMR